MLLSYTLPSRKLMVAAALVTLAAGWLVKFSRARVRRRQARLRSQPGLLQRWEGEAQVPHRETSQAQALKESLP